MKKILEAILFWPVVLISSILLALVLYAIYPIYPPLVCLVIGGWLGLLGGFLQSRADGEEDEHEKGRS